MRIEIVNKIRMKSFCIRNKNEITRRKKCASPLVLASKNFCHEFETTRIFVPTPMTCCMMDPELHPKIYESCYLKLISWWSQSHYKNKLSNQDCKKMREEGERCKIVLFRSITNTYLHILCIVEINQYPTYIYRHNGSVLAPSKHNGICNQICTVSFGKKSQNHIFRIGKKYQKNDTGGPCTRLFCTVLHIL